MIILIPMDPWVLLEHVSKKLTQSNLGFPCAQVWESIECQIIPQNKQRIARQLPFCFLFKKVQPDRQMFLWKKRSSTVWSKAAVSLYHCEGIWDDSGSEGIWVNQLRQKGSWEGHRNTLTVQRKEQVDICTQLRYWKIQPLTAVCISDISFLLVVVLNQDV